MITIESCRNARLLAQMNAEVQDLHHRERPEIFKPFDQASVERAFGELLEESGIQAFLARHEGNPAGYMLLMRKEVPETAFSLPQRFLLIDQIGVEKSHRRHGVGIALLEKAKEVAESEGIRILKLDHWTWNEGARRFFQKAGFSYYMERMEMQLD